MKIKIIAVAGASGSGKTTIAKKLCKHFGHEKCLIISSDNYYKPFDHLSSEEKSQINFDHPSSIDFELLSEHLQLLKKEQTIFIPTYDFSRNSRQADQVEEVKPKPIIIVEGILVMQPSYLRPLYDCTIYVDADQDVCFKRRLQRDMLERGRTEEQVISQYEKYVKPMYLEFVEPCRDKADVMINNRLQLEQGDRIDLSPILDYLNKETLRHRFFKEISEPIEQYGSVSEPLLLS